MTSFASILDKPSEGGKRPPPLPAGSYICIVRGLPEFGKSAKKETPYAKFILEPLTPLDDVDSDDLAESGGLSGRKIFATYYLTDDAQWRLEKFLQHCGVDEPGISLGQLIERVPGQQVVANLVHKPYQDGSGMFAELSSTAAVDD